MELVITREACMIVLAVAIITMARALWVTRGDRKYTDDGERKLVATFAVGYLIIIVIIIISSLANIA